MRLFLIFFVFTLFAEPFDPFSLTSIENDPSLFIDGKVNAITGKWYVREKDLTIQGVEPIVISRLFRNGSWVFSSSIEIVDTTPHQLGHSYVIKEDSGADIRYQFTNEKTFFGSKRFRKYVPVDLTVGYTNTSRGHLSSRTNLQNNVLYVGPKERIFLLHTADGTVKTYENNRGNYLLRSEHLPNGNWIFYDYLYKQRVGQYVLASIRTTNPAQDIVYARADFIHEDPKGANPRFVIVGSDGQTIDYRYNKKHELIDVLSPSQPNTQYEYDKDGTRIKTVLAEGRKVLHSSVYSYGQSRVNGVKIYVRDDREVKVLNEDNYEVVVEDPRLGRIKELSKPIGNDQTLVPSHSFIYDIDQKTTSVFDSEGVKTNYHWDQYFRVSKIVRYDKSNQAQTVEQFLWSSYGNLLAKSLSDGAGNALWLKVYRYNEKNDLISERLFGNLSGRGPPLRLHANLTPVENGVESFGKTMSYIANPFSLLQSETDDRGVRTEYSYLPNTDLITSKLIYEGHDLKEKHLFEYDQNNCLIAEIVEMGTTHLIRWITRKPDAPYQGMPWIIEEKSIEAQGEKLLRKTVLQYTDRAQISQKEIFNSDNEFSYRLQFKYDEKGRLKESIDQLGRVELFGYDVFGNRTYHRHIDGRNESDFTYDFFNRQIGSTQKGDDGIVLVERYEYNRLGKVISEQKPFGAFANYHYNDLGYLIKKDLPLGSSIRFEVDPFGRTVAEIDAAGNRQQISYNTYGKKTRVEEPDGGVEEFIYNLDGSLKTIIDAEGVETTYTYDYEHHPTSSIVSFAGRLVASEFFEYSGGLMTLKVDREGGKTHYRYDSAGRLRSVEAAEMVTQYQYDLLNRPISEVKGDLITVKTYDLLDRVIREEKLLAGQCMLWQGFEYDASGNRIAIVQPIEAMVAKTECKFDSLGRNIETIDPMGSVTKTIYEHTPTLKETSIDPMGQTKVQCYNAHQKVIWLEISKGHLIERQNFFYDVLSQLVEHHSEVFHPSRQIVNHYRYDSMGRLVEEIEAPHTPLAKITKHAYNKKGKVAETIKPDGVALVYTYDPLGSTASIKASDGSIDYQITSDRLGRMISCFDGRSEQSGTRVYNAHGKVVEETLLNGACFKSAYDQIGRRSRFYLSDGSSIGYRYDGWLLREVLRFDADQVMCYNHVFSRYDQSGHLLEEEHIHRLGSSEYRWNLVGQKSRANSPVGSHEILSQDLRHNILSDKIDGKVTLYEYDALYQLTKDGSHEFVPDGHYCRLAKDGQSYTINDRLQISSHRTYDLNGNVIEENGMQFKYDALDRLIEARNGSTLIEYTYDVEHRRLSKIVSGNNIKLKKLFLYDGQKEIGALNEEGQITELRVLSRDGSEAGTAVAFEFDRWIYAPIHDLFGNVKHILSCSWFASSVTYHYSAFQEESAPTTVNPWRYGSKRIDEETGLIFYGRRYYSPTMGTWLTTDPIEKTGGTNLYAFVKNNPLCFLDHFGLYTSDRASDVHYFDPNHPESSNFSIGTYGSAENGTVDYYSGVNNCRDSMESAQYKLHDTLGAQYAVNAHWIHDNRLLKGLSLVASAKMKCNKLLKIISPNVYALSSLNLECSYIEDVIDYQTKYIAGKAEKIRAQNDPSLKQVMIAFSFGVHCTREALTRLPEETRQTAIVIALGGTTRIENHLAHKVYNLVGDKDYASKVCNQFSKTDNINLKMIPQHETKLGVGGHYFEQPDYQESMRVLFDNKINPYYKVF